MNHRDIEALIKGIAPVVRDFVSQAVKGLSDRIADLETRAPEKGEPGTPGRDGVDGKDGASVAVSDLAPMVADEVRKAVGAIAVPKDGLDGKAGLDGKDGRDGIDGKDAPAVTRDDILAAIKSDPSIIADGVSAYLKDNPPAGGRDGKDADPVTIDMVTAALLPETEGVASPLKQVVAEYCKAFPPPAGRDGQPGVPGRDGKDGLNGKDGAAGLDGLGFDDLAVEFDGERKITLAFVKGDARKAFDLTVPAVIDRGVWREGSFKAGDGVSWDGSWFVAQKDTDKRPGTPESGWRLAAKRGRDGASAFDVAKKAGFKGNEADWLGSLKGKPGEQGRAGRDLTQMTLRGEKY